MAKFDIKTVKPKFVVTTSPENKIDVVVNKPVIETKLSKSFFKLKNTGGPAGKPGRDGQDGESATIEVASTTTLPAGSSATVENVGTDSAARLAFGIPKGDTGADGQDGDAATIQVGQVETLEPNQQAYVTNVGTSAAAIFNIGIPKGQKGDSGSGSGDMTASVYDPNGTVAAAGGIPDYVDSNGGKIDTIKVNGTPQTITNKTVDLSVPTKTSDLTNDGSDNTSTYVEADELATVATSGSYNDLSNKPTIPAAQVNSDWDAASGVAQILNKPTIPTVNNATLTIQKNGTTVKTFTANASTDVTADIAVPTQLSDLSGTISTSQIADSAVTGAKIDWSGLDSHQINGFASTTSKNLTGNWQYVEFGTTTDTMKAGTYLLLIYGMVNFNNSSGEKYYRWKCDAASIIVSASAPKVDGYCGVIGFNVITVPSDGTYTWSIGLSSQLAITGAQIGGGPKAFVIRIG